MTNFEQAQLHHLASAMDLIHKAMLGPRPPDIRDGTPSGTRADEVKYLVYPMDYRPEVAEGPPETWATELGYTWTPTDTQQMREMESLAVLMDYDPANRWVRKINEKELA